VQKDLTEVKIFKKVLGEYFLKHPVRIALSGACCLNANNYTVFRKKHPLFIA